MTPALSQTAVASVALVTGGVRGLGREISITLARQGHTVFAIYQKDGKAAAELASLAENEGLSIFSEKVDITDEAQIDAFFQRTEALRSLKVLVNNASPAFEARSFSKAESSAFRNMLEVNLISAAYLSKKCIPHFKAQGGGSIVNVLSSYVLSTPALGTAPYTVSKYALLGLTKALAAEYAKTNINVNAVAPGVMDCGVTLSWPDHLRNIVLESTPRKRFISTADVASIVAYLVSDACSSVTGAVIPVLDGASV